MTKQILSLKARALRYLSIREYSVKELTRKLQPLASESDDVDSLVQWLVEQGFLSEKRFVESYVHRKQQRYGSVKVLLELQQQGIDGALLTHARELLEAEELANAKEVWLKKFGQRPASLQEKAKQIRFLRQRGFSSEISRQVVSESDDEY